MNVDKDFVEFTVRTMHIYAEFCLYLTAYRFWSNKRVFTCVFELMFMQY